jgi:hypothetical protein
MKTPILDEFIEELQEFKDDNLLLTKDLEERLIEFKNIKAAINYTHCCEELNPDFEIGEQVLLTKRTIVTIETFCEDGMIEIDDNNEYYKVDKDELTKRV